MTDRVYPSTKPNGHPTPTPHPTTIAATLPTVATLPTPPSKTHLYNPNRHPYRPIPTTRRRHKTRHCTCRRCCCLTCFWSTLLLIAIILLAATAAAAFYLLYHPRRPSFSVTSLKITSFNLTTTPSDDTTHLTTKINITLSAKNPNKKIIFFYDPMSITVLSNAVTLSNGAFTNFTNSPDTIYIIHTAMAMNSQVLDADAVNSMNSDLKRKNGLPMKIVMDTMVGVKLENIKMKKIGIRVKCNGIHGEVPKGKNVTAAVANTSKAKCKVDLRIKIWKWTF
ncbi:hypothetical protein BUALT_Bualt10G0124000 [Buddleja alternifolia]|uniref:Late embryogenesis abundant protein LEA-2 subgroup domain-containing protein n=1 Tax=Buddleja alternifolia TaxID=168488 RepID=A0AAV6WYW1_9LAMI|nr:hypothetical protein BUALT_Bualt10G0124000 [Buddleja alternifolia]